MNITDYLTGKSSSAVVRDLNGATGQDVEVLFLVESPHSEELDRHTRLPAQLAATPWQSSRHASGTQRAWASW